MTTLTTDFKSNFCMFIWYLILTQHEKTHHIFLYIYVFSSLKASFSPQHRFVTECAMKCVCVCVALQRVKAEWKCVLLINSFLPFLPPSPTVTENSPNGCHGAPQQSIWVGVLVRTKGMKKTSALMQGRGAHPLLKCLPPCVCVCERERLECLWRLQRQTFIHYSSHCVYWPHLKFVSSTYI